MNKSGFNDEHEALMSEYRPLIDPNKIGSYRRKPKFGQIYWLVIIVIWGIILCLS